MNLSTLWDLIWKTPVALLLVLAAGFAANQAGWSGAELIVNAQLMGVFEDLIVGLYCMMDAAVCYGLMAGLFVQLPCLGCVEWFLQ